MPAPAPVEPVPVEPVPVEPVRVEPASVEPVPVEPASVEPVPVEPVPVEPLPVRQAPVPQPRAAAPAGLSGVSVGSPARSRRGRSLLARLSALFALAVVIVAVVLLLHAHGPKTVAPPAPPPVVKVLIPEGKTRAQIAQIATADHLKGSYRVASRHSSLLDPAAYGAPKGTPDLEGFLFPATYDMNPGASVNRLVEEQLIAFRENFGASEIARARALHVTPYQLLIVASMVEREAQVPGDRSKIAAVIYNRLTQGMPLGIDASIYYAIELRSGVATYTQELTEAQLHINSPYNTRTHVGLPPTPISNPGVASIEAAAHPAHVSYLYYVAGADGCGEQVFSNTLAEFEVNAAAYKAAVVRSGGHPPTCKHN
jgi:cell division protein YceG involved in septum cleavage